MLLLLKVFYYCFMDFFLFLKMLMIVFEIVAFAKVLYPSSCFSPCLFGLFCVICSPLGYRDEFLVIWILGLYSAKVHIFCFTLCMS